MMQRFDRLVMPDGRRAPIHAERRELYHALQAKSWMWKEQSNREGEAARASSIRC